jgi:hypothetical protein
MRPWRQQRGKRSPTSIGKEKTAFSDAIGGLQDRLEAEVMIISDEEAEEGRVAAGEAGVGGEAAPGPGDGGGAGEERGQRREAEENL